MELTKQMGDALRRKTAKAATAGPPVSGSPTEDEQALAYWDEAKELIDARRAAEQEAAAARTEQADERDSYGRLLVEQQQRATSKEDGVAQVRLKIKEPFAQLRSMSSKAEPARRAPDTRKERPDREGTRMLAAHFDPEVYRDFKILAAEQGQNTNTLMNKAVELLFESFGRKPPKALRKKLATHGL